MRFDWQRCADQVQERRIAQGMSKREAIRRAAMSSGAWLRLENDAQPVDDRLFVKFERALNWAPGSMLSVLRGGDAVGIPEPPSLADQIDELRRRVERLESR